MSEYREISEKSLEQMINRTARATLIPIHYFDCDELKFKNILNYYNIKKNNLIKKHCK